MILTVMLALVLGLTALLGALRGVTSGLLALAGTLLAAVLIDLWSGALTLWVQTTFPLERPNFLIFLVTAALFLGAAGIVGYGGAALLPPELIHDDPGLVERLVALLLGFCNGALISGYLLRYAGAAWADGQAIGVIASSSLARLLVTWLPWYVLAMVGATVAIVLVRLVQGALARAAAGYQSVASAPNLAEADRRLSAKIDQVIGKD